MKNTQTSDIQVLEALRNARDYFDQPNVIYSSKKNDFTDPNTGFVFNSSDDLLNSLHEFGFQGKTLKEAGFELEDWYELLKQQQETITEAPRPEGQTATTLTSNQLENLEGDVERIKKSEKIREDQKKIVSDFEARQKEIYKEKQSEELLQQLFKGKKVIVVPNEEIQTLEKPLTKQEKEMLFEASKLAQENPLLIQQELEKKIIESINASSDTTYTEALFNTGNTKTSVNLTDQLQSIEYDSVDEIPDKPKILNPTSIFIPFTDPNNPELINLIPDKEAREKFAEKMQILVIAKEAERTVNVAGTRAIYSESIAYSIYGPENITSFRISNKDNEKEDGIEIDLQKIYKNSKDIVELYNKLRSTKGVHQATEVGLSYYPSYTNTGVITKSGSLAKAIPATVGLYTFSKSTVLSQWARAGTPLLSPGNQTLVRLLTSQAGVQEIASASMVTFSKPIGFQLGRFSVAFTTGTNQSLGTQVAVGGIRFGEKMAGAIAVKGGTQVAVVTGTQAGAQLAVGTSTALTKILTVIGGLGSWATAGLSLVVGYVAGKIVEKLPQIKKWFQENGPVIAGVAGLGGLVVGGPVAGLITGGLLMAATGTLGAFVFGTGRLLGLIGRSTLITISTPVIVTLLVLPPLVAFIMLVINNSAYVVPPSFLDNATIPPPPIGGLVSSCEESEDTGPEITEELAGRIKNGVVKLLPETVWGRRDGICIKPTMIVMHWSAGTNDNPDGNQRTYETLVARNLSCQLATDTNDNWLMERFFEKMVEFPACAGSYNTYSINNEMAGVYFTANPPPPNLEELELAYDATCKVMDQYDIPWSQIRGHYQVPNSGKQDPGKDFLEKVFIPEIRKRCPNDRIDTVRGGEETNRADTVRNAI